MYWEFPWNYRDWSFLSQMILKITSHLDILDILVASMAVNILRGKYLSLKARQKEGTRNEGWFWKPAFISTSESLVPKKWVRWGDKLCSNVYGMAQKSLSFKSQKLWRNSWWLSGRGTKSSFSCSFFMLGLSWSAPLACGPTWLLRETRQRLSQPTQGVS